jgi:hypothetical protein
MRNVLVSEDDAMSLEGDGVSTDGDKSVVADVVFVGLALHVTEAVPSSVRLKVGVGGGVMVAVLVGIRLFVMESDWVGVGVGGGVIVGLLDASGLPEDESVADGRSAVGDADDVSDAVFTSVGVPAVGVRVAADVSDDELLLENFTVMVAFPTECVGDFVSDLDAVMSCEADGVGLRDQLFEEERPLRVGDAVRDGDIDLVWDGDRAVCDSVIIVDGLAVCDGVGGGVIVCVLDIVTEGVSVVVRPVADRSGVAVTVWLVISEDVLLWGADDDIVVEPTDLDHDGDCERADETDNDKESVLTSGTVRDEVISSEWDAKLGLWDWDDGLDTVRAGVSVGDSVPRVPEREDDAVTDADGMEDCDGVME